MEKNNKSMLVSDIENLLGNYISKKEVEDFCSDLENSNSLISLENVNVKFSDAEQINSSISNGIVEREFIQSIINFSENRISEEYLFKLMLELNQLMIFNGELNLATEISEELISKIDGREEFSLIEADAFLALAKICWSQAYWDLSIHYVQKSHEIFSKSQNFIGFAKCENLLGSIFGEQGDILKAQEHFKNGLEYLNDTDDQSLRSMLEINLGILFNMQGEHAKAMWNFKNALQKCVDMNDLRKIARVRHNLGMLYTKLKDYQAAVEEFDKSISLSIENGYLSNCAIGYIGKAYIYTQLNNTGLAEAFTDKALEIAYKINDALSIAEIYKIKGMIQSHLDNFELSEEMFENSLRLNEDFENKFNLAECNVELSKLYQKTDKNEEAEELQKSAISYYDLIKAKSYIDDMITAHSN